MDTISDNTAGQKPRDALQNELEYQRQVRNKSGAAGLEWAIAEIDRLTAENARQFEMYEKRIVELRVALERIVNHPRLPRIPITVRTIARNALNEETKWYPS